MVWSGLRTSLRRSLVLSVGCLLGWSYATATWSQAAHAGPVSAGQYLIPTQLPATQELFNPMSGFYTSVGQKPPGPKNPPCATCALDLNFQPLPPAYSDAAPLPGTPLNMYGRMSWHSLEPKEGQYDFSIIDNVIEPCPVPPGRTLCLPQGGRFGFRIMALNPQYKSATNVTADSNGYPIYSEVPSYIEKDAKGKSHGWLLPVYASDPTQGSYFIPDWNDPYLLERIRALLSALGERYNNDPRIGWIDIGLYGSWGEWHTGGLPDTADYKYGAIPYTSQNSYFNINTQAYLKNTGTPGAYQPGTEASKDAIVLAHIDAFPDRQLVMLTDDGDGLCTAMHADGKIPVGLRRDSLGSNNGWNFHFPLDPTGDCTSNADQKLITERWKMAPFTVEPFGNGSSPTFPCQTFETDPATGKLEIAEQVTEFHLAAVKNGAFCTGTWSALTPAQQAAIRSAALHSGYRYAPAEISISPVPATSAKPLLAIQTTWANTGVTPAYDRWVVEYSLWTPGSSATEPQQEAASFISTIDLRKVLPTSANIQADAFALPPGLTSGSYELRIRVIDADGYLNPMQLALQGETAAGYYPLGQITVRILSTPPPQ